MIDVLFFIFICFCAYCLEMLGWIFDQISSERPFEFPVASNSLQRNGEAWYLYINM